MCVFSDSTNVLTQILSLLSGPNRAQVRQPAAEGREWGSHTSHQQTVQVKGRPALLPGVGGHTHPDMALWMSHDVPSSCYTLSIGLLKREREKIQFLLGFLNIQREFYKSFFSTAIVLCDVEL